MDRLYLLGYISILFIGGYFGFSWPVLLSLGVYLFTVTNFAVHRNSFIIFTTLVNVGLYNVLILPGVGSLIPFLFVIQISTQKLKLVRFSNHFILLTLIFFLEISKLIFELKFRFALELTFFYFFILFLSGIFASTSYTVISKAWFYGVLTSFLWGLIYSTGRGQYVENEVVYRMVGGIGDPNYFARYGLFGLALSVTKVKEIKVKYLLELIFYTIVVISTLSKMAFIIYVILLLLLVSRRSMKITFNAKIGLISGIVVAMFVANYLGYLNNLYDRISIDFGKRDLNSISSNRSDLIISGLNSWSRRDTDALLLGVGYNENRLLTESLGSVSNVLHNLYAVVLVESGALFFIIYFIFWMNIAISWSWNSIALILVYFLTSLALGGFFFWDLLLFYVLMLFNDRFKIVD